YSTKVVNLSQFFYELLSISTKRRLYHHLIGVPHFHSLECTSKALVVEVSPIGSLPADCQLLKHLGFNLMPSN
ncbi:MAG: hypothetical protein RR744_10825, partial [Cellulosilyticaceae bacterium]